MDYTLLNIPRWFLAHLLAWVRPSPSQQAEAEIETAIEELENYRKAHPRRARTALAALGGK